MKIHSRIILAVFLTVIVHVFLYTVFNVSIGLFTFPTMFIIAVIDFIWYGFSKTELGLDVLEHYHWALLALIFSKFLPLGCALRTLGIYLLISEMLQTHPFAIESTHFWQSTVIGIVLTLLLALSYIYLWIIKIYSLKIRNK